MSRPMPPPHILAAADREYAQARDAIDNAAAYQLSQSGISYAQLLALSAAALTTIVTEQETTR